MERKQSSLSPAESIRYAEFFFVGFSGYRSGDGRTWQDLEVITLDSQGNPTKTVYYSYGQLLTLPLVTVKTERDPNRGKPATYTGIYISNLFEAFGADAHEEDV